MGPMRAKRASASLRRRARCERSERASGQVRPDIAPVTHAEFVWVPKLFTSLRPKAWAIDTRILLLVAPTKALSPGAHQTFELGQSAGALRRRPMRNFPLAPPASTVGTLRV